jgi:hypothetical protein
MAASSAWIERLIAILLPVGSLKVSEPAYISLPRFEPYRVAAAKIPEHVARHLVVYAVDCRIALALDRGLVGYPWEALMSIRSRNWFSWAMGTSLDFVRCGEPLPRQPAGLEAWSSAAVQVVSRYGLDKEFWPASSGIQVRAQELPSGFTTAPLRVLHLIGRTRRGSSGAVFSISSNNGDLDGLVSIDRLPLQNAAVVIVQEEPVERLRRLDVDREQTADGRDWVGQVFHAGAQTAIFIPAMPQKAAEVTIGAIAHELHRPEAPDIWCVLEALRAARRAVMTFGPRQAGAHWRALAGDLTGDALKEARIELALDITLFARAREFQPSDELSPWGGS